MSKYKKALKLVRKLMLSGDGRWSYLRSYRLRLYPSPEQMQQINQEIGNFRFIYNHTLAYLWDKFTRKEKVESKFDTQEKLLKELNEEYDWIKLSTAQASQHATQEAYEAFMKLVKNAKTTIAKRKARGKFRPIGPRFKRKHESRQSYCVTNQMFRGIDVDNATAKILKLGKVKFYYKSFPNMDNIRFDLPKESRIVRENGKYYLSLTLVVERDFEPVKQSKEIGIDWGLHYLLMVSRGKDFYSVDNFLKKYKDRTVENQNSLISKLQKEIDRLNKIIDHKVKVNKKRKLDDPYHSKNIQKLRSKIYALYQRISNIKNDYLNKVVYNLVKDHPKYIAIEDLSFSDQVIKTPDGTAKDKKIRKLILGTSPYMFRQKLVSACIRERIELRVIDKNYPSSQICSKCGTLQAIDLGQRKFKCKECGFELDRDQNASKNIRKCKDYRLLVDAFGEPVG